MIAEVHAYRELLFALTYRDITVKYKQAVMGVLWVFFLPVLAISSGIMFRLIVGVVSGRMPVMHDIIAVMVKTVPWLLFASIVGSAAGSLLGNVGLITKIYFPRQVVPLSNLLASLFDFSISLAGLVVLLLAVWIVGQTGWVSMDPRPPVAFTPWLLLAPALLATLVLLAGSLGLILACANLFLRDVKYIVQVLLQFGIFFSLVYFKVSELGRWGVLMLVNPVAPLLEGLRMAVVEGAIDPSLWPWLAYSVAVALGLFYLSLYVFDRAEHLFAEYA